MRGEGALTHHTPLRPYTPISPPAIPQQIGTYVPTPPPSPPLGGRVGGAYKVKKLAARDSHFLRKD